MTDMSKFKVAKAFQHLDPDQGLADGISSGFSSIRYRGKVLALSHGGKQYPFLRPDDGSPLTYIDFVILGISPGLSKTYFGQEAWTEESASGPICASLKGDVPDPGVSIPQSKSCGICSHNEWITKPTGGRGKECQDHKRMAILLMPAMTKKMLGAPLLDPVHLKIPPGSLKSLKSFSDELQTQGIPFASVVTRMSFAQDQLFQLKFEVIQALTDAEAPLVLPLMENPQTRAIMGSMPEVRELAAPKIPDKVDTGLMAAFAPSEEEEPAQAPPPRRNSGRPRAVPPAEKMTPKQVVEEVAKNIESDTFEESDTDLDDTVAKLMGDKLNKMLK